MLPCLLARHSNGMLAPLRPGVISYTERVRLYLSRNAAAIATLLHPLFQPLYTIKGAGEITNRLAHRAPRLRIVYFQRILLLSMVPTTAHIDQATKARGSDGGTLPSMLHQGRATVPLGLRKVFQGTTSTKKCFRALSRIIRESGLLDYP